MNVESNVTLFPAPTALDPISPVAKGTIYHGDCLSVLPTLPAGSAHFGLTDPPYIVRYRSRDSRTIHNDDNDKWLLPAFGELYRVLAKDSFCVSFYGWPHTDKFMSAFRKSGFSIVGHFVFPKPYTSSTSYLKYQHECAFLLAKGYPRKPENTIGDVIPWSYSGNKFHPTQKPLSILTPLVRTFSKPGQTVIDPFAGSGSSLLAAKKLGRHYVGIEYDATYHGAAESRLAA